MGLSRANQRNALSIAFAVVLGSIMLVPAPSVGAHTNYPNLPFPDDTQHNYCFHSSVYSGHYIRINDAMSYLDSVTDMYDVNHRFNCASWVDVRWMETDLPSGIFEYIPCVLFSGWPVCDSYDVQLDGGEHFAASITCTGTWDQVEYNWVISIRHELGHTVALPHELLSGTLCTGQNGTDAMISDWVISFSWAYVTYNSHNTGHVNGFY